MDLPFPVCIPRRSWKVMQRDGPVVAARSGPGSQKRDAPRYRGDTPLVFTGFLSEHLPHKQTHSGFLHILTSGFPGL